MRDLSKKIAAGAFAIVLLSVSVPLVHAQTAPCVEWSLIWAVPPAEAPSEQEGGLVSSIFYPGANPFIGEAEPAPPTTLPSGSDAAWTCTERDAPLGSAETLSEQELGQGMALCAKAADLAARFGRFTALQPDFYLKIQTNFLNQTLAKLQKEVFSVTGLDIQNIPQSALNEAGEFVGNQFDSLIGNPLKDKVNEQKKAIEDEAKKLLGDLARDLKNELKNAVSDTAGGFLSSKVPTDDTGTQDAIKALERKADAQIAEQKKAQLLADTREKCRALLTTTNETIRKTILYQLSNQIVDWIQTGEKPQFIKQPGKFLEETGQLAVDRFLSRVAPRLCEPFRLNVQLQIPTVQRGQNPFYEQVTCTVDKVVKNVEGFYKDFRNGGWVAYQEVLKPQNNYYGALLLTQEQALREQQKAQEEAARDLDQGNGYRSERECVKWIKYEKRADQKPAANDFEVPPRSGRFYSATESRGPTADGNAPEAGLREGSGNSPIKGAQFWRVNSAGEFITDYFWQCEEDRITRPGNIAAGLASRASQADLDALAAAQDVGLFLQVIEDAIVNKLVKAGVKGFQGILQGLPPLNP